METILRIQASHEKQSFKNIYSTRMTQSHRMFKGSSHKPNYPGLRGILIFKTIEITSLKSDAYCQLKGIVITLIRVNNKFIHNGFQIKDPSKASETSIKPYIWIA